MRLKRLFLLAVGAFVALLAWFWWGLPARSEVRALAQKPPGVTAVMRQREAEAKAAGRTARRTWSFVPIRRVSRHLVHAVLASEDQKFFGHEGVDWDAVRESVEANRQAGRFARGGSTITQQLAKNLFFSTHKSLPRKARELVVAYWLERDLSKVRILELYLNVIEWGDGVYGCQAAALRYYGKPASALDATEAAGLAAMIPNPRRINPRVSATRHARAQRRVLWLMAHAGYLSRQGLGAEPPPPEPVEDEGPLPTEPAAPVEAPPPPTEEPTAPPPETATPVPPVASR